MKNTVQLIFSLSLTVLISCAQTTLGPCDYDTYPATGCVDELGSECARDTQQCVCKSGNWYVIAKQFCFLTQCDSGQYYDHNRRTCEQQRKASTNSEENYCKHNFHCRGSHVSCKRIGMNNFCVCDRGFAYETSTQLCERLKGVNGYCQTNTDCSTDQQNLQQLYCIDNLCQCSEGYTYNNMIDGCEDNERIRSRDSQTRTMIYIFILVGIVFGAALSLRFGASPVNNTRHMLLKRVVEERQRQSDNAQTSAQTQAPVNNHLLRETA